MTPGLGGPSQDARGTQKAKADVGRFSAFLKNAHKVSIPAADAAKLFGHTGTLKEPKAAADQDKVLEQAKLVEAKGFGFKFTSKALEAEPADEPAADETAADRESPNSDRFMLPIEPAHVGILNVPLTPENKHAQASLQPDPGDPVAEVPESKSGEPMRSAAERHNGAGRMAFALDRVGSKQAPAQGDTNPVSPFDRPVAEKAETGKAARLNEIWKQIVNEAQAADDRGAPSARATPANLTPAGIPEAALAANGQHRSQEASASVNAVALLNTVSGNANWHARLSAPVMNFAAHAASGGRIAEVLKLKLHPVELGQVEVSIRKTDDAVAIVMKVENAEAATTLNADIGAIQTGLRALGYQVDSVIIEQASQNQTEQSEPRQQGSQMNGNRQPPQTGRSFEDRLQSKPLIDESSGDEKTSDRIRGGYII